MLQGSCRELPTPELLHTLDEEVFLRGRRHCNSLRCQILKDDLSVDLPAPQKFFHVLAVHQNGMNGLCRERN